MCGLNETARRDRFYVGKSCVGQSMQVLTFFFAFVAIMGVLIGLTVGLVRRSKDVRGFIVSTYKWACLAFVLMPNVLVAAALALAGRGLGHTLIFAALTFLVTAFIAGGALSLVSIAENTREAVEILQRMEQTELLPIATDVPGQIESRIDLLHQMICGARASPHHKGSATSRCWLGLSLSASR